MISKRYKIRNFRGDIEPHEVFLDKLAKKKEEEWGIAEKKIEVPLHENLAYFIFGFFVFISIVLFARIFYLQVIQGQKFTALAKENYVRIQLIRSERGVIYDKNLKQLVFNSPTFDLLCDKRDLIVLLFGRIKEVDEVANILGIDPKTLREKIEESDDQQVLIAENLSHQLLVILEARIKELPGFKIESNTTRDYVDGFFFSHLLGYMGKVNKEEFLLSNNYSISDYIGKTGVEKSYEEILRGGPEKIQTEKDAFGNKKSEKTVSSPKAGKSLVLYLDYQLQKKLTEELQKRLEITGVKKAAAVALDPKTGGVLAMVSIPSFDNNILSKGISVEEFNKIQNDSDKPFFNRAISGQYPTGSTIKPFIASAALQEKIISPEKQIYDPGYIEVKSQYDPNIIYRYSGLEEPGYYDMRKAIAKSSNIYFYTVGGGYKDQPGLGPSRIKKYLEFFGWGKKTGIDLPNESNGFVPWPEWKKETRKESWWDGDTYHLSIGQGYLLTTPLQVATAFVAIANGGTLYQPQVVKKIVSTKTGSIKTIKETEPIVIRSNFIDPENLNIVKEGMRQSVISGTGQVLQSLPVSAASKTGTAQTSRENIYDIWVGVFAPYENPQIVLTIMVEDVEGLHVPSLMVAREVLDWYFTRQ